MPKFKDTAHASTLRVNDRFCTCCGKPLKATFAWLELDQRTWTYHDFGNVPGEKSQGAFPFGLTCAGKKITEAKSKAIDKDSD